MILTLNFGWCSFDSLKTEQCHLHGCPCAMSDTVDEENLQDRRLECFRSCPRWDSQGTGQKWRKAALVQIRIQTVHQTWLVFECQRTKPATAIIDQWHILGCQSLTHQISDIVGLNHIKSYKYLLLYVYIYIYIYIPLYLQYGMISHRWTPPCVGS